MATLIIQLIILGKQAMMIEKFAKVSDCIYIYIYNINAGDVMCMAVCLKNKQLRQHIMDI